MTVSRRSALSVLGLGAAATIAPEDFSSMVGGSSGVYSFGVAEQVASPSPSTRAANLARMVAALRNLAADIEIGGTHVQEMSLSSVVRLDDFLTHSLRIDFSLRVDDPTA